MASNPSWHPTSVVINGVHMNAATMAFDTSAINAEAAGRIVLLALDDKVNVQSLDIIMKPSLTDNSTVKVKWLSWRNMHNPSNKSSDSLPSPKQSVAFDCLHQLPLSLCHQSSAYLAAISQTNFAAVHICRQERYRSDLPHHPHLRHCLYTATLICSGPE
jgi:hypothetical protein